MRRLLHRIPAIALLFLVLFGASRLMSPLLPHREVTAQGATPAAKPTFTISGDATLNLFFNEISADKRRCEGPTNRQEMSPPYGAGMRLGEKVVVRDEKGVIIALGALGDGEKTDGGAPGCRFPFSVENVPVVRFYEISIFSFAGNPTLYFSSAELREAGKEVHFTIP